jgi:hypothetical protein
LELCPLGTCHVQLPNYNQGKSEHYSWKKVTTCVNNVILGTLSIEHYGDLIIKNHSTGEECCITFKKKNQGWFGSSSNESIEQNQIVGTVKDGKGVIRYEIKGTWDDSIQVIPVYNTLLKTPFLIWKINPKPIDSLVNFRFTFFGMILNQTSPELMSRLPLTDSRFRPDQRAMEQGSWDEANEKKQELETRQRNRRKILVAEYEETNIKNGPVESGIEFGEAWWQPRWFTREIDVDTNEFYWKFTNEYWKYRENGNWPEYVEDIFGIQP